MSSRSIHIQGTRVLHITPFSFEESVDEKTLPYDDQWDKRFVREIENGILNLEATDRPALQHHHHDHYEPDHNMGPTTSVITITKDEG